MADDQLRVLIASPLEPRHVARIEAADSRVSVLYEPGLLPVPRYPADHTGVARELSAAGLGAWAALRRQADVSFDFDWQAPADMVANCPRLRWVQATSAGIGGFLDRTGLAGTGLVFTTAAGVDGSRALLVGLGGAGRAVARLLAAAGVEVYGAGRPGHRYDVPGVASYVASDQLHQVLPEVEALVLACPLTEQTRGLIGAAELALMRQGSVLVNISRGAVVDEEALVSALRAGHLRGACLDVFATEPLPAGSPLWDMPNVIVSPHSAATVAAENALLTDLFIDNLQRWLAGRPLRNTYDRVAGY